MVTSEFIEEVAALAIRRILEDREVIGGKLACLWADVEYDSSAEEEHNRQEPISDEELIEKITALGLILKKPVDIDLAAMIFRCSKDQVLCVLK